MMRLRVTLRVKMISAAVLTALCLTLPPASGEGAVVPAPQDVHFFSVNLRNTLRWSAGPGSNPGTTFTVEYAIYGDSVGGSMQVVWSPVEQCRDITHTECDVTDQMRDITEDYFGRVRANGPQTHSEWVETTRRFRPFTDTMMGPPHVKLSALENFIGVTLKGPFRWRRGGVKKGPSLWKMYPHMTYDITVLNNKSKHTQHFSLQNDSLWLGPLEYEVEHCVKAEAHSLSLPLASVQSEWTCITVPPDPFSTQMLVLILGGVIPTAVCLFVFAALGGFLYYHICGHRQKLPMSTDVVHMHQTPKMFQPEKPFTIINLNLISTSVDTESKVWSGGLSGENEHLLPLRALPFGGEGGPGGILPSYAPQDIEPQAESDARSDVGSDAESDLLSNHSFLGEDYGLLLHLKNPQPNVCVHSSGAEPDITPSPTASSECPIGAYAAQTEVRQRDREGGRTCVDAEEQEEEVKQEGTFLDWDPRTGVLTIPLLCHVDSDVPSAHTEQRKEAESRAEVQNILTSVVVRQVSQESGAEEDVFAKMEKDWGLRIQSNPE
ncbi:interleukin-20 receptor subunit alpha [Hoplias malabaricus]|uniref:interleukin-20 receptor subunit alpha n=1 Tax=Hoplias malabaricus TaxID=27720 RepID=UPI0034623D0D